MPAEKATAIVLRTTDWSETSRIATLWTREFGKVRVVAKGGRRLKSAFDNALDLLTLCSIVLLRKSSGGLDLLTEAQVVQRFPRLGQHLPALYAAYYVAELLGDWTEEYDPHPNLFDQALATLRALGASQEEVEPVRVALRVMRFEMQLLIELGYAPVLDRCASCSVEVDEGQRLMFGCAAGGVICLACQAEQKDRVPMSDAALGYLRALAGNDDEWKRAQEKADGDVRRLLGQYVTWLRGRRPRMLTYLEATIRDAEKGS